MNRGRLNWGLWVRLLALKNSPDVEIRTVAQRVYGAVRAYLDARTDEKRREALSINVIERNVAEDILGLPLTF